MEVVLKHDPSVKEKSSSFIFHAVYIHNGMLAMLNLNHRYLRTPALMSRAADNIVQPVLSYKQHNQHEFKGLHSAET